MKGLLAKFSVALVVACGSTAVAHAIPVSIHMTGDNMLSGGLCTDSTCTALDSFSLVNDTNWMQSDSVELDLGPGTYWFTWTVTNLGAGADGNPAALLAEILWDDNASYSSAAWEVYDPWTDAFIAATTYGSNGGDNIWSKVNGGSGVSGISTNASWIYTASNFTAADPSATFRTSITVVPEPTTLSLLGMSLLGFGLLRRRRRA